MPHDERCDRKCEEGERRCKPRQPLIVELPREREHERAREESKPPFLGHAECTERIELLPEILARALDARHLRLECEAHEDECSDPREHGQRQ